MRHGGLWEQKTAGCRPSVCMESGVLGFVCSLFLSPGSAVLCEVSQMPQCPLNGPTMGAALTMVLDLHSQRVVRA